MNQLVKRVENQLANNWPVDKKDIETLLSLARILINTLNLPVHSEQNSRSLNDK